MLFIRTLGTNFSEILSEINTFSFRKTHLKMSSAKWLQIRIGLHVLKAYLHETSSFMVACKMEEDWITCMPKWFIQDAFDDSIDILLQFI